VKSRIDFCDGIIISLHFKLHVQSTAVQFISVLITLHNHGKLNAVDGYLQWAQSRANGYATGFSGSEEYAEQRTRSNQENLEGKSVFFNALRRLRQAPPAHRLRRWNFQHQIADIINIVLVDLFFGFRCFALCSFAV